MLFHYKPCAGGYLQVVLWRGGNYLAKFYLQRTLPISRSKIGYTGSFLKQEKLMRIVA